MTRHARTGNKCSITAMKLKHSHPAWIGNRATHCRSLLGRDYKMRDR